MIGKCGRCGETGVPLRFDPLADDPTRPTVCDRCADGREREQKCDRERERERGTSWTPSEADVAEARDELVVATRGVTEAVGDEGHIMLLDVDGSDRLAVERLAAALDGPVVLWESSPDSWHLWCLSVRDTFEQATLDALACRLADPQHVAQSWRRKAQVLRCGPKVREDGTVYKSAPELVSVAVPTVEDADAGGRVSRPHLDLAQLRAAEQDAEQIGESLERVRDRCELVGDAASLETHSYLTLTDDGKRQVRGGGEE